MNKRRTSEQRVTNPEGNSDLTPSPTPHQGIPFAWTKIKIHISKSSYTAPLQSLNFSEEMVEFQSQIQIWNRVKDAYKDCITD